MTRLRLMLAVVALGITAPVLTLGYRAWLGMQEDQERQRKALAETLLDQASDGLLALWHREDEHAFEAYRYATSMTPRGAPKGDDASVTASPLAGVPDDLRVLIYFQISPTGHLSTPHLPSDRRVLTASQDNLTMRNRVSELRRLLSTADARAGSTSPNVAATVAYVSPQRGERVDFVYAGDSEATTDAPVPIHVGMLTGRPLGNDHFMLLRNVVVASESFQQGVLLSNTAIEAWVAQLAAKLLPQLGLTTVTLRTGETSKPKLSAHNRPLPHPFHALVLGVTLPPLPAASSGHLVSLIAIIAMLVSLLGLFVVYRSVAMRVAYAERRDRFVSAVTHELRTPLTVIRMNAEMLAEGMLPTEEKRLEYYHSIATEADRLGRLINNVLDLARLDDGKEEIDVGLQNGPILEVVTGVLDVLRPHASRLGFSLELEQDPVLPDARYERDGLAQILFNLVDNALKYAKAAEHKIVHIYCSSDDNQVLVFVRDHGPGVPASELTRLTERFYRGTDEATQSSHGTGIGLALVQGLAAQMRGQVVFRNVPEGGFEARLGVPIAHPTP